MVICGTMGEDQSSGFPNRSVTKGPVQSQKGARILKFWIKKKRCSTICVAKTKMLLSCAVTVS